MTKNKYYHAKDSDVYHDGPCTSGNNIEAKNKQKGKSKRLCKVCKKQH